MKTHVNDRRLQAVPSTPTPTFGFSLWGGEAGSLGPRGRIAADPFGVKQRRRDQGGQPLCPSAKVKAGREVSSSPCSPRLWSGRARRPERGASRTGREERKCRSRVPAEGRGRPVPCSALTRTGHLETERTTRVSIGAGGSCGELMESPPNQRRQLLTPSRPLGLLLGAFFPQISPCFMSCQKPRSFYEISHSFQHPQLTFQN